jgi:hypothetical protein
MHSKKYEEMESATEVGYTEIERGWVTSAITSVLSPVWDAGFGLVKQVLVRKAASLEVPLFFLWE